MEHLTCAFALVVLTASIYVWLFNYFHFVPFEIFKKKMSTPQTRKQFISNIFKIGFLKSSFRNFARFVYLLIYQRTIASMGQIVPNVVLITLDGKQKSLLEYCALDSKPLILTIGSYSWPPFVGAVAAMTELFHEYADKESSKARLLTIYIEEAHAADDWSLPHFLHHPGADLKMHRTFDDRVQAAQRFIKENDYPIEVVCDSMENSVLNQFEGWPERLYIIENSIVVYKGEQGPFGYKPHEVRKWLENRFPA